MAIGPNAYRALFPYFFNARGSGASEAADRRFETMRLPRMRVLGPFWSFGVLADNAGPYEGFSQQLGPESLHALTVMQELYATAGDDGGKYRALHTPMLLRARAAGLFTYDGRFPSNAKSYDGASTLSILGVDTLDENLNEAEKRRRMPIVAATAPAEGTTELVLANIGPGPRNRKDDNGHLPAMQLLEGQIAFTPDPTYLTFLRQQLGLEHAADMPGTIYLRPEGFAVFGKLPLPWRSTVAGWFRVTPKHFASGEGKADAHNPVLRAWVAGAPESGDRTTETVGWETALRSLDDLLVNARRAKGAPLWLRLGAHAELEPEDLHWPLERSKAPKRSFLIGRAGSATTTYHRSVRVDDSVFLARLAFRPTAAPPLTSLTLKPGEFTLEGIGSDLLIRGKGEEATSSSALRTVYRFGSSDPTEEATAESVSINDEGEIELAVPVVQTAARLREMLGITEPAEAPEVKEPREDAEGASSKPFVGLLWAYAPIRSGWLHFPLPDATLGNINRALEKRPPSDTAVLRAAGVEEGRAAVAAGALGFYNRPGSPGYEDGRRIWSFTLSDPHSVDFSATVNLDTQQMTEAEIKLGGGTVETEGALALTPFRQRVDRILPDHAERALSRLPLTALSPELLRGVEGRMWRQAREVTEAQATGTDADDRAAIRIAVRLSGIRFEADPSALDSTRSVRPMGDADLDVQMRLGQESSVAMAALSDARRAWLWARQAHIPAVQTLPLALASDARSHPSGTRELAPFESEMAPSADGIQSFHFDMALDGASWVPDFVAEGAWHNPITASAYHQVGGVPHADEPAEWLSEVGMALLSLPSITVFPGFAPPPGTEDIKPAGSDPDRLRDVAFPWVPGLRTGTEVEIRHDLAIRDEAYAGAAVPPMHGPDGSDASAELRPPEAAFRPQADNGPGRAEKSAWKEVWTEVNRRAALAATQDRAQVIQTRNALYLSGHLGGEQLPLTAVGIGQEIAVRWGDTDHSFHEGKEVEEAEILNIGTLSFGANGPETRAGLPAESDLSGLSGTFKRKLPDPGPDGFRIEEVSFDFGTAVIDDMRPAEGGNVRHDQSGLAVDPKAPVAAETLTLRYAARFKARRQQTGAPETETVEILTLRKEISAGNLRFWCADVPIAEDRRSLHPDAVALSSLDQANAAALATNHLLGFRWYLREDAEGDERTDLLIDGFLFRPLRLAGLKLAADGILIDEIRIRGEVALATEAGGAPIWPSGTAGEADLRLYWPEGEAKLVAPLQSAPPSTAVAAGLLRWPLTDPDISAGFSPYLELDAFPGEADVAGHLHHEIAGRPQATPIIARIGPDAQGRQSLMARLPADLTTGPGMSEPGLGLRAIFLSAPQANPRAPFLLDQAEVFVDGIFNGPDWHCETDLVLNLVAGSTTLRSATLTVGRTTSIPLSATAGGLGLTDTAFHLVFEWSATEHAPVVFDAFALAKGNGMLTVGHQPLTRPDGAAGFRPRTIAFDLTVELETRLAAASPARTLRLEHRPDGRGFRLFGALELPNRFAWPDFTGVILPSSGWSAVTLPRLSGIATRHAAKAWFDGQSISFADMEKGYAVDLRVDHRIESDTGGQKLEWAAYHRLQIQSLPALLGDLDTEKPPSQVASGDPLSVAGITPPAAGTLDIDRLQGARFFFHGDAARHAALTGRLRAALLLSLAGKSGAAVQLSAHHRIILDEADRNADTVGSLLLSLPHLALMTNPSDAAWDLQPAAEALLTSQVDASIQVLLSAADLPQPDRYGRIENHRLAADAQATRRRIAAAELEPWLAPALALGLGNDDLHRPAFQQFSVLEENGFWRLVALRHPGLVQGLAIAQALATASGTLRAFGYAERGRVTRDDLQAGKGDPDYTEDAYSRALTEMRVQALGNSIEGPVPKSNPENGSAKIVTLILRAVGREGDRVTELATQNRLFNESGTPQERFEEDRAWAEKTLARLAPWAQSGTLTRLGADGTDSSRGVPSSEDHHVVASRRRRSSRPTLSGLLARPTAPQPQQIAPPARSPAALPARAIGGYRPLATGPALVASDNGLVPGAGTDGPGLTATAARVAWGLSGGSAPVVGKPGGATAYWMTSRHRSAFREAKSWRAQEQTPQRLTANLPEEFAAAVPGGLMPAAEPSRRLHATVPAGGRALVQSVLPGFAESLRISPRSGIWSNSRLGAIATGETEAGLSASALPAHLRTPRPPLLAVNDRTRASSHEPGHLTLSDTPLPILHGPRRAPPGGVPGALDRSPRSAWATVLKLAEPETGVVPRDWSGRVRLTLFQTHGSAPEKVWQATQVDIRVGFRRFSATRILCAENGRPVDAPIPIEDAIFAEFRENGEAAGARLDDIVASLPPASGMTLMVHAEAVIKLDDQEPGDKLNVKREVRIDLVASGTGLGLTERPLYVRFDDPEYNDRLTGQAKISVEILPPGLTPSDGPEQLEILFAADRPDIRPDDTVQTILALRPLNPDERADKYRFGSAGGVATLNEQRLFLCIERERPGDFGSPQTLTYLAVGSLAPGVVPPNDDPAFHPIPANGDMLVPDLDLSRAVPLDARPENGPVLRPGDRVVIRIFAEPTTEVISLTFDVVLTAAYPGNPSGYALLSARMDGSEVLGVHAPLYASGPAPAMIEIVDRRDLLFGIVRRRAIYLWQLFAERDAPRRYALQKVNAVGASWIEPDLASGWRFL